MLCRSVTFFPVREGVFPGLFSTAHTLHYRPYASPPRWAAHLVYTCSRRTGDAPVEPSVPETPPVQRRSVCSKRCAMCAVLACFGHEMPCHATSFFSYFSSFLHLSAPSLLRRSRKAWPPHAREAQGMEYSISLAYGVGYRERSWGHPRTSAAAEPLLPLPEAGCPALTKDCETRLDV